MNRSKREPPARRPDKAADAWGVCGGYEDAFGDWRPAPSATLAAIRAAMGAKGRTPAKADEAVRVLEQGTTAPVAKPSELRLEDGGVLYVERELPRYLPLGYHTVRPRDGGPEQRLVVTPHTCHLPDTLPAWGWSVQLYSVRSADSWGMGDLRDLRRLARWSAELGAGVLQINPLCAATPVVPQQPSPYYPSSRCFRNPLYLCVDEIPGAAERADELRPVTAAGRRLNRERLIDRDAVFRLKMDALSRLYEAFRGDPRFDAWCVEQGGVLDRFATFCALAETHGADWRAWPEEFRHPDAPAVDRFARRMARRIGFHKWLQWQLDEQFRRAAVEIAIVQDLPIGIDPAGADAWMWQDTLARGVHVGAPPDVFNVAGQDWGLEPFVPHKLRTAGYEPFIETVRASLRHGGGLRIDHVMGLFRLFWVPEGRSPAEGCYVRSRSEDLLGILALESRRTGTPVIGEDLGTVEPGVREELAARRILSYRLLWFEPQPPRRYPELSLAAVTTHDLPTIAGLWTGSDLEAQARIGLTPERKGTLAIRRRLRKLAGLREDANIREVIKRTHRLLAEAPSLVVLGTLEDALAVHERPNMPGTVDQWPNWSIPLPKPLERIQTDPLVRAVARALHRG